MGRSADRDQGAEGARISGADDGLAIDGVGGADVRTKSLAPDVGELAGADAARARAGEQNRAGNAAGGGIRRGGPEVAPTVVQTSGRQVDVVAQSEVQNQLGVRSRPLAVNLLDSMRQQWILQMNC